MRFAVKPWLIRIWHAPEHFRLMDPLPPLHRRGIIAGVLLLAIGFLWPTTDSNQPPQTQEINLSPGRTVPIQAESEPPLTHHSVATPAPNIEQSQAPVPHANNDIEQQWRTYRVAAGQTMAQLFRDHNLPPADVYAMAQVEGDDKPLSSLQAGQMVQIRQNANGVVTGLTIDIGNDRQVLFTRQPDGSFLRVR